MSRRSIRIGNAGGYWGDDPEAARRQIDSGRCDYLTADYLAETTLAILQRQASEDPSLGYATDFVRTYVPLLPRILERGTKIVVNAGGVAPLTCARVFLEEARKLGVSPKVAAVDGDAVSPGAHAYLGAAPIAAALAEGADVVITGRVADAALVLGPCLHAFGWSDLDRMAQGIAAGHLLECGAQVTGGNSCQWRDIPSLDEIGFPIAEIAEEGAFVLSKIAGSGGRIDVSTVKEQLLYEVGDPTAYLTPDLVADFSSIKLEAHGKDVVRVTGARGRPATPYYKVTSLVPSGWKIAGSVYLSGPNACQKADLYARLLWKRCPPFEATLTEMVGCNAFAGVQEHALPNDIELRLSARDSDRRKLAVFAKLLPSLLLSGPPGVTYTGSLPKVVPILKVASSLVEKTSVEARVHLLWDGRVLPVPASGTGSAGGVGPDDVADVGGAAPRPEGPRLSEIAFARSGDKGDSVNIAVFARHENDFPFLVDKITASAVKGWFGDSCRGRVSRYKVPGLFALNFVLEAALDGGGTHSLRLDALGKGHAQSLLRFPITRS